jgi:hypothetical protein
LYHQGVKTHAVNVEGGTEGGVVEDFGGGFGGIMLDYVDA